MALFRPYRITSDQLSSLTKAEGQLIIVSDTKSMYLDISDTERIRIGEDLYTKLAGIATGATKVEASSTNGNIKINGTETKVYTKSALTKSEVTTALGYTPPTSDTNTTYTLTQDSTDGHKITFTPSSGNATTITIPDNNTTYSAGAGVSLSGTTFSNSGVRSIATGSTNGTISVNTNGTSADVAIKGLGSLAYKSSLNASDVGAIASSLKGAASGVAELDSNGKVPSAQLPSYVDDVLEYNGKSSFPATGETGKIYVDTSTNLTYRWSGSAYVEISASLALGTTSSTAFRGDYGNTAYTHATDANRLKTATASGLYKIAATANGHVQSLTAVTKADITALGIPGSDTNTWIAFKGATSSAAGTAGYVPAPAAGDQAKFFRADGTWVVPTNTDTKNTAGSTDTSSKIFLIGATSQAANPQTYSQDTAYVGTDGHLYSNGVQVVNLSGSQALTNKTYNGYTLAAACAKGVDTSLTVGSTSTNLPTSKSVASLVSSALTWNTI